MKSTPGAIGYADVAYALSNKLRFAKVKNKAGVIRDAGDPRSGRCGEVHIKRIPAGQRRLHRRSSRRGRQARLPDLHVHVGHRPAAVEAGGSCKRFLLFAISKPGQQLGLKLLYAPIPDAVRLASAKTIAKVKQAT